MEKDKIILGSGKLYCTEFTGELPADSDIETDDKRLGYIKGGATITYSPSFYEAKDDLGVVTKKIITEESASFKSGIMTLNAKRLSVLCNTGRVSEKDNIRMLKIGGVGNFDGKKYLIHFVHEDQADGDIRIDVVGTNEAGFTLSFQKDTETVVDAEFKCQSMDKEGTLILYREQITKTSQEGGTVTEKGGSAV